MALAGRRPESTVKGRLTRLASWGYVQSEVRGRPRSRGGRRASVRRITESGMRALAHPGDRPDPGGAADLFAEVYEADLPPSVRAGARARRRTARGADEMDEAADEVGADDWRLPPERPLLAALACRNIVVGAREGASGMVQRGGECEPRDDRDGPLQFSDRLSREALGLRGRVVEVPPPGVAEDVVVWPAPPAVRYDAMLRVVCDGVAHSFLFCVSRRRPDPLDLEAYGLLAFWSRSWPGTGVTVLVVIEGDPHDVRASAELASERLVFAQEGYRAGGVSYAYRRDGLAVCAAGDLEAAGRSPAEAGSAGGGAWALTADPQADGYAPRPVNLTSWLRGRAA